jgi:membrane-associated protease RseP (regulator of RpoE activity)
MITKKPIPKKLEMGAKMISLSLLLLLMIVVTFKDVIGLF